MFIIFKGNFLSIKRLQMNHPKLKWNGFGIVLSFPRETWFERPFKEGRCLSQGMCVPLAAW